MFIRNLKLHHFRSHTDTQLELERLTIIRGLNGSGKSSIQMAIEYALTGQCQVTDAAGRGAEALITEGAGKFVIGALIEQRATDGRPGYANALIHQERSAGAGTTLVKAGTTFAGKGAYEWIARSIASPAVLSAVLNSHRFVEMAEKEQKALLAMCLGSKPVELPPEISTTLTLLGFGDRKSIWNVAECEQLYKLLYSMRTETNQQIKALGVFDAPEIPREMPSLEQTQKKLQSLREELRQADQARAKLIADHRAFKLQYETAKARLPELDKDLMDEGTLKRQMKIAGNKEKVQQLEERIRNEEQVIIAKRDLLALLKSHPATCPTCYQPWQLDEKKKHEITVLEKAIPVLEEGLSTLRKERMKLGEPADAAAAIERHKKSVNLGGSYQEVIKNNPEPSDQPDTFEIDATIEALQLRIKDGETVLGRVQHHAAAANAYDRYSASRRALTDKLANLEKCIPHFDQGGDIRSQLVGDHLAPFVTRINESLERWGWMVSLSLEPYTLGVFLTEEQPGQGFELHQLSESERYRFGIALQVALAEATGVGLVVIDRADMLTAASRRVLTEILGTSGLDQAIVLSTTDTFGPHPELEQTAFYDFYCEQGTTMIGQRTITPNKESYAATE